jgi:hypothetical protein
MEEIRSSIEDGYRAALPALKYDPGIIVERDLMLECFIGASVAYIKNSRRGKRVKT